MATILVINKICSCLKMILVMLVFLMLDGHICSCWGMHLSQLPFYCHVSLYYYVLKPPLSCLFIYNWWNEGTIVNLKNGIIIFRKGLQIEWKKVFGDFGVFFFSFGCKRVNHDWLFTKAAEGSESPWSNLFQIWLYCDQQCNVRQQYYVVFFSCRRRHNQQTCNFDRYVGKIPMHEAHP